MPGTAGNITELVGNTPLVRLSRIGRGLAAEVVAKRSENKDRLIVVILPDSGERYLSTGLFGGNEVA